MPHEPEGVRFVLLDGRRVEAARVEWGGWRHPRTWHYVVDEKPGDVEGFEAAKFPGRTRISVTFSRPETP
jgi:hypothetical protein